MGDTVRAVSTKQKTYSARGERVSVLTTLARELLRIAPRLVVGLTLATVALAALRAALMILIGALLSGLQKAIRSGDPFSRESHALHLTVGLLAICYLALHAGAPFMEAYLRVLTRVVDRKIRRRLVQAVNKPHHIEHLEDPYFLNALKDAEALGAGEFTFGGAAASALRNLQLRLSVIFSALILVRFSWMLALSLLVAGWLLRFYFVREQVARACAMKEQTAPLRRAEYFRGLALSTATAKEIRIFGLANWLIDACAKQWSSAMATIWHERQATTSTAMRWNLGWGLLMAGAFYALGYACLHRQLPIPEFAVFAQALIGIGMVWVSQDDVRLAFGAAAYPSLAVLEATASSARCSATTPAPRELSRGIEFKNVSFRYPGASVDIYTDLNLFIPAGKSLALVGLNGAGKTTLIKLLARLYSPTSGAILADGVDIRSFRAESWQKQTAVVFQDFVKYPFSAHDNVALRKPGPGTLDAVRRATQAVGLRDVLERLPRGFDTVLWREAHGGVDLSGGEWQRVAIARALHAVAQGANILVLDEPTANLDPHAEADLMSRFMELTRGITTILISHRFSSIRHADRIAVLSEASICEQGTHEELLQLGGQYAEMFRVQASRFKPAPESTRDQNAPSHALHT